MPDTYRIFEVEPGWILEPEEMGSKDKFWFQRPDEDVAWLFKYPQLDTGQHWAEKIAAEIAELLQILHAKVELATFQEKRGSITESFARRGRSLYHGNQLLEGVVHDYEPAKEFDQSRHTLANILQVMSRVFEDPEATKEPEAARRAKLRIAEYLVLDALIGNTDRHHENWGILRKRVGENWQNFVAPSFDHASSLGRELPDESRSRILAGHRVGDYAEKRRSAKKGRGAIYWSEDDRHGLKPLELVRRATRHYPDLFCPALMNLERLDKSSISNCVNGVPSDWMTPLAREFAITLMCYNRERLEELLQ